LPSLKRSAALKFLVSLYGQIEIPQNAKMAILCSDDFYTSIEAARLIKKAFPSLELYFFAISDCELPKVHDLEVMRWENQEVLSQCDFANARR
jgi:hypothetical protein